MAIRVEFYAKDQVTASSIVEFALSSGAVLQGYSEVDAPLEKPEKEERGARGPYKKRTYTKPTRPRMDYKATTVEIVTTKHDGSPGTIRAQIMDIILSHKKPTTLNELKKAVQRKMPKQHDPSVRGMLRELIASKHLKIIAS